MPNKIYTRSAPVGPASLDAEARTVQAVLTTETPVRIYDWDRGQVEEVLLMSGLIEIPEQIPMLNSHNRGRVGDVLGSVVEIQQKNDALVGKLRFSSSAKQAFTLVEEGHCTDVSVGYTVEKSIWIPEDESQDIEGKLFDGPLKVCTEWKLKELSVTPLGADENAKIRSQDQGQNMPKPNEILKAERTRCDEILSIGSEFNLDAEARTAINDGLSVADFQAQALEKIRADRAKAPDFRIDAGQDDSEKFRSAAESAILTRAGLAESDAKNHLESFTLRELARECLTRSGQRVNGDAMALVGRALSSSDLPNILANTANKSLFAGFEAAEETWQVWCGTGSLNDFKQASIAKLSEVSSLKEIPELAEYELQTVTDAAESVQAKTYGGMFVISRAALVNDDLNALASIPKAQGEAAAATVGDLAYSVLTANGALADGTALFHADHSNIGSAGIVSVSSVADGIKKMKLQKDLQGIRSLGIRPKFFIAPVALEGACEQFYNSAFEGTQAKPNLVNPYAGKYFTRVYDPRLDADSATAWYLAGPKSKTVTVFFLNGQQRPFLESRQGWSSDGTEFKVRIDAAAAAVDHRALLKNNGA